MGPSVLTARGFGALLVLTVALVPLRVGIRADPPAPPGGTAKPCLNSALLCGAVAGIGYYLRSLDRRARAAVAAERRAQRLDLARDLHDFAAHDVTGVVVLARAAQVLAKEDPGQVVELLAGIEAAGLGPRLTHCPAQLSGGRQQRVACVRALVGRPRIVFADEPTGNLDSRSAAEILALLRRCVRELGQTVVMVTHDPIAAGYTDRVVFLADGRIVDELAPPTPDQVLQRTRTFDTNLGISHWSGPA